MNNKGSIGSVLFIGLFALCYFIAGMVLYQFLKAPIDEARTGMECTNPDTWGDKGVCLIIGSVVPLVILTIFSITGGVITDKMLK